MRSSRTQTQGAGKARCQAHRQAQSAGKTSGEAKASGQARRQAHAADGEQAQEIEIGDYDVRDPCLKGQTL